MHKRFKTLWLFLIAASLCLVASSQNKRGTITGVIIDARTKLPVAEAVITVSSDAFTGQMFALSNSAGLYKVNNLRAGNYQVSFEMEGYEKLTRNGIALQEGIAIVINADMLKDNRKEQIR